MYLRLHNSGGGQFRDKGRGGPLWIVSEAAGRFGGEPGRRARNVLRWKGQQKPRVTCDRKTSDRKTYVSVLSATSFFSNNQHSQSNEASWHPRSLKKKRTIIFLLFITGGSTQRAGLTLIVLRWREIVWKRMRSRHEEEEKFSKTTNHKCCL